MYFPPDFDGSSHLFVSIGNILLVLLSGLAQQTTVLNSSSETNRSHKNAFWTAYSHQSLSRWCCHFRVHIWLRVFGSSFFLGCFVFINCFALQAVFIGALFSPWLLCSPAALWLAAVEEWSISRIVLRIGFTQRGFFVQEQNMLTQFTLL